MQKLRSHLWNLMYGYGIREQRFGTTQRHGGHRYSPTDYHGQPPGRRSKILLECDFFESDLEAS